MAEKDGSVVEWKIENFSCWNEAVHGKYISSPDFLDCFLHFDCVEFFPRGISGQQNRMEVLFCNIEHEFFCDLAFIDFNGSLLCSQEMEITPTREYASIFGLQFEDYIAQMKGNKDEITLQFRFDSEECEQEKQHMCTTILISEVCLKIDSNLMIESHGTDEMKPISYIRHSQITREGIFLKSERKDGRIELIAEICEEVDTPVFMKINLCMLYRDDIPVTFFTPMGSEEMKHVFTGKEKWIFLKLAEADYKGTVITLHLKTVNGKTFESHNYAIYNKKVNLEHKSLSEPKSSASPASSKQSDSSVTILSEELMGLYQDQKFSDFQLKCGDTTFPVHRAILSARSPVFASMLSSDMLEKMTGQVAIDDLDSSTLAHFLTFLYTGAVGKEGLLYDRALNLYFAADKYQVPSLKKECVEFLCANLAIWNVCNILTLADKHKDDDLFTLSQNFILLNFSDVLKSKEWVSFMEVEPVLAVKLVTYLVQKNYVGRLSITRS